MILFSGNWSHLAMLNFTVEPESLLGFLPYGVELDLYNGRAIVSLVGFAFTETRLFGFIPLKQDFEEINWRFYVKRNYQGSTRKGIVFLREYVSTAALALGANLFNENYSVTKTERQIMPASSYHYLWGSCKMHADIVGDSFSPQAHEEAEFLWLRHFNYTKYTAKRTLEFEVQHPAWEILPAKTDVTSYKIPGCKIQGNPYSAYVATGSKVTMLFPRWLKDRK
jgi:uncharacterized protein YqjF (DUF2071 family)